MFDRRLVTSGFDTETIVSGHYLMYMILAQIEAGRLALEGAFTSSSGDQFEIFVLPPEDYDREYEPQMDLPEPPESRSFVVDILSDEGSPFASAAFSPDMAQLVSGSWDGLVRFWEVSSGRDTKTVADHTGSVSGVAYSKDGERVASSSVDGTIRVMDASGKQLTIMSGHVGAVFSLAFSTDRARVVSCGADRTLRVWDTKTGAELIAMSGHAGPVLSVAFSPDGTRVASGSLDRTVRLWDAASGAELATFSGHDGAVHGVVFSPDGTRIASGSEDHSVRLWSVSDGKLIRRFKGHKGPVTSVAFRPDGTRIVSGSEDQKIRLWNAANGNLVRTFTGHHASVLSVAFSSDGTRIASGSIDKSIRLWNAATGDEVRAFRIPFLILTLRVRARKNGEEIGLAGLVDLKVLINLDVISRQLENGLESNHRLDISLSRLHPDTVKILKNEGLDPADVTERLANALDRQVALPFANGAKVQQLRIKKFVSSAQQSVGFYVNLALRTAPEPDVYLEPRGNINLAQDFRPFKSPLAFATSPNLFSLLGPAEKFRRAEETEEGSGEFHFPLHEDFDDKDSPVIGKLKGITIKHNTVQSGNLPPVATNELLIEVHGEYTFEDFVDPDFRMQLILSPEITDGIVDWGLDVDIKLSFIATLILFGAGMVIAFLYAPIYGCGTALVLGPILGLGVAKELLVEPELAKMLEGRVDEEQEASILDAIPFRVPAATRRWDPFYNTVHQVVTRVESVVIDERGIAFEGVSLTLDRKPVPVDHVVIRDEARSDTGAVVALRYRVSDFERIAADLTANGPGVDRMAFSREDAIAEPTLVTLTRAQIDQRLRTSTGKPSKDRRVFAPIYYTPERIFVEKHQIDGLLCLSEREVSELRDTLIRRFREQKRDEKTDEIRAEVIVELEEELGRQPTADEISNEVDKRLDAFIEEIEPAFIENELPGKLEIAVAQALRFDLAPEELAELQLGGVVFLVGKEIITRRNADGSTTTYYRDKPDEAVEDNLLSLPRYVPPYQPPP